MSRPEAYVERGDRRLTRQTQRSRHAPRPAIATARVRAIGSPGVDGAAQQRYEYAEWQQVRINIDYHVITRAWRITSTAHSTRSSTRHCSVERVIARVELFHRGKRIASHLRSFKKYTYTATNPAHRPASHGPIWNGQPRGLSSGTVNWVEPCSTDRARHPQQAASRTGLPLHAGYPAVWPGNLAPLDWSRRASAHWPSTH